MSTDPYGPPPGFPPHGYPPASLPPAGLPPASYPPGAPRRRGWPSWLIASIGIVGGALLMALPVVGLVAVAQDSGSAADLPRSSHSVPSPDAPTPTPATPSEPLEIDFPDGARATFTLPAGMEHDAKNDDDGHVSMQEKDTDAPFLDVYADRTAASRRGDLHAVATSERAYAVDHGGTAGRISYTAYAGQDLAQFHVHFPRADEDPAYDTLVTVALVQDNSLVLYWGDRTQNYEPIDANADELLVLRSLDVDGGSSPTT